MAHSLASGAARDIDPLQDALEPDPSTLPSFVLVAWDAPLCDAWRAALADLPPAVGARFKVKEGKFDPDALAHEFGTFDCVVSPANAFGIMDGGYDLALSRAFVVDGDVWALTNAVQDVLRADHRGYLPPGSCALVPLTPALTAANALGCTVLAVLPTMRMPEDVSWHRDLVYECTWNLLAALGRWNRQARAREGIVEEEREGAGPTRRPRGEVKTVLMTGLGTGVGEIGPERCARQMCLAALNFARGWGERPRWEDVRARAAEIDATRGL